MTSAARERELGELEVERIRVGSAKFRLRHIMPNLKSFELKVYSQFGEDGAIDHIGADLGIEQGTLFEFGIGPVDCVLFDTMPLEGNCVLLREKIWRSFFLGGYTRIPAQCNEQHEFVTAPKINLLFVNYKLPVDLDFISIDVDGQEFWI